MVFDGNVDFHEGSVGDQLDTLHQMSLFGVRLHTAEQPRFVVESDRVDVERVTLPSADRMAVPGGKRFLGMRTVKIDPPHAGRVDEPEDHDDPAALLQPEKPAGHAGVSEDPQKFLCFAPFCGYKILPGRWSERSTDMTFQM